MLCCFLPLSDFLRAFPKRAVSAAAPDPVSNGAASLRTSPLGVEERVLLSFVGPEPVASRGGELRPPFAAGSPGPLPSPEHSALLRFGARDFSPVSGFSCSGDCVMTFSGFIGRRLENESCCSLLPRCTGSVPAGRHGGLPARREHVKVCGFTRASLAHRVLQFRCLCGCEPLCEDFFQGYVVIGRGGMVSNWKRGD